MSEKYLGLRGGQVWPQDAVRVPMAIGTRFMPPVALANIDVSRQESYTMTAPFTLGATTVVGQVFSTILNTDQDADFYCEGIYASAVYINGALVQNDLPPVTIEFIDIRTGRNVFYNQPAPIQIFRNVVSQFETTGYTFGNTPYPDGFRSTGTLPTPICFTRQGGMRINIVSNFNALAGDNWSLYVAFGGWKEYTYASR